MTLINPYENIGQTTGRWHKVNFHTHSGTGPGTCGELPLKAVIDAYGRCGYDALCISNHDLFTDTDIYSEKITMLPGVEYSADPHMLTIGVREYIEGDHQSVIDKTNRSGGFVVLCHPNWKSPDYWSYKCLLNLTGFVGIEIMNTVVFGLNGSGMALDKWDYLLTNHKLIWGFGNDDFHFWNHLGKTFNMIYAASPCMDDIQAAIRSGSFYVSSGLLLDEYSIIGDKLTVRARPHVESNVNAFEYKVIGRGGELLERVYGPALMYNIQGDEEYLRIEATMENGAKLFLQPLITFKPDTNHNKAAIQKCP